MALSQRPGGAPALVLASRSPRRQAMLRAGGLDFAVHPSEIDEGAYLSGAPAAVAVKTALAKAEVVAAEWPEGTRIISADTVVVVDGAIFNKPLDRDDACRMLRTLAGRGHTVTTGLALKRAGGEALVEAVSARVIFNPLSDSLIRDYVDSGEADDKAGAYGIQGLGANFVAAVEGDLTGVIGLPLARLTALWREFAREELFARRSLRAIALAAFPELRRLPVACIEGIPEE